MPPFSMSLTLEQYASYLDTRGLPWPVAPDVERPKARPHLTRLKGISGDYIPQRELDDTQTEIESLLAQKKALEPRVGERIEMTAPVSGVISVANVRAGQVVSARDTLFEIVDPERLWIEATAVAGADETSVKGATAIDGEGQAGGVAGDLPRNAALDPNAEHLAAAIDDGDDAVVAGGGGRGPLQDIADLDGFEHGRWFGRHAAGRQQRHDLAGDQRRRQPVFQALQHRPMAARPAGRGGGLFPAPGAATQCVELRHGNLLA